MRATNTSIAKRTQPDETRHKFMRLLDLDRDSREFSELYAEVDRLLEVEMRKGATRELVAR